MRPLHEQTIIVTGATDGPGLYLAGELAARGATVVVHGRNPGKLERVRTELDPRAAGPAVMFWALMLLGFACLGLLIIQATRSDRALVVFCVLVFAAVVLGAALLASVTSSGWDGL